MNQIVALHKSDSHTFSKLPVESVQLIDNEGVESDAHCGMQVKHRVLVQRDPEQPNLRQVHLIQAELFDELKKKGFTVTPGALGENITTSGVDLLALPQQTRLVFSGGAELRVTGLRTLCSQLNKYQHGLTSALVERDANGSLIFKAGIFAVVEKGGEISTGEAFEVVLPPEPHLKLEGM